MIQKQFSDYEYHRSNGVGLDKRYDLATHSVKVKRSGTLVDVNSLWDMEGNKHIDCRCDLS